MLGFNDSQCNHCQYKDTPYCDELCPFENINNYRYQAELNTNMDYEEWEVSNEPRGRDRNG